MDNEKTINLGIDLGTTNSAIAKFIKGEVKVYNNPKDFGRSTLPSVVSYQKDKILVGTQAKVMFGKQKQNTSTHAFFKRKMGTSESFPLKYTDKSVSPIELSAQILKELKTFVDHGVNLDSAVITIPASFDLIQSNATKDAGYSAGFKQVVLLQEPIAASLAYANMKKDKDLADGRWLVYDFGGGTFDVALVEIKDGEMKVRDHEGNNFLGGADIDQLIVDKLVIPKINERYSFENLENELKSSSGKYNSKYYILLHQSEEAKIHLSSLSSEEIIIDGFVDEVGNEVDFEVVITRSEFNELIKPQVDETLGLIKRMLSRNSLRSEDVNFTLMVGGSTYIPYVRTRVEEILQIPVNCEIDPTTAIAIGAAHYAATKQKEIQIKDAQTSNSRISIKTSYNKASKDKEELFAARITGNIDGLSYRIVRQDGGYDSGLKKLEERISEDLPLVKDTYNFFSLTVYDEQNNIISTDVDSIGINSGFGINGQPLPEDISLEVDDYDNPGQTRLLLIFERNTVLPTTRTLTFPLNKSVIKGSIDNVINVNVVQGSHLSLPESNKTIGLLQVNGNALSRNVAKGSDIEISISLSESQDLTISAYLNMVDQEFMETFNPKERHTQVDILKEQIQFLSQKLQDELKYATETENFETANILSKIQIEMDQLVIDIVKLADDDVTDKRYQLEDKKRKVAQEIDNATKYRRLYKVIEHYKETKEECNRIIELNGNDHERKMFADITAQEESFLSTKSPVNIQEKSDELHGIITQIRWRTPEFLVGLFKWLNSEQSKMNDLEQAKSYIDAGRFAVESENWDRLRDIDFRLLDLLPKASKDEVTTKIGFGL